MTRLLSILAASMIAASSSVLNAQPSLSHAVPSAVVPGQSTEIVLHGAKLDDPLTLWTSFPATVEIIPPADGNKVNTQIVCKMTLEPSVPVQIGGVIVATPAGVSNALLLMIDDLQTVAESGSNNSLAGAQPITLPVAVDGVSAGGASDNYKFTAKAGQRVSFEAVARRVASPMDAVMWLRDAAGRELAFCDDDPSTGVDSRLQHTFAADGEYVIEIRDNAYQAGRRYRLRVGDFPLISTAIPLGAQRGQSAKFEFASTSPDVIAPTEISVTDQSTSDRLSVGAKYPSGISSALATVVLSDVPELVESEPNEKEATKITLPCAVSGRFQTATDSDVFEFTATKGERYTFRAFSRSLGSPAYVFMRLTNADGGKLTETGVSDKEEESFVYAIPADGTYRLVVEDLLRGGGPEYTYRVEIKPTIPFSLSLKSDQGGRYQYVASKDGALAIDLVCARNGYDGPITLSAESSSGALPVVNNVIAEKQAAAKMIVYLPPGMNEGNLGIIRVVGRATIDGKEVAATADTFALLRAKWPQLAFPPEWHDGLVTYAVASPGEAFYAATADRDAVYLPRGTGTSQFTIDLERKNKEYKDPLLVFVEGLPENISYAVKREGEGEKEKYHVTLTGPADLPEGKHAIRAVSFGEFKGRGEKTVTPDLALNVITPVKVTVAPAAPLVVGQKQKVKISVTRFSDGKGDDPQPVTIKWKKLPGGVTGPEETTIAVDQNEIEVELAAAADATPGKFEELTVEAATKYQGQDIKVESPPASLEVKASE